MKLYQITAATFVILFACALTPPLLAQGAIVEQVQNTFNQNLLYEVAGEEFQDANFFLNLDLNQLKAKAKEIAEEPETDKFTLYIQGQMLRMDSPDAISGFTVIIRKDLGMMYFINRAKNTVVEMSMAEMKKMAEGAQQMASEMQKNMPDMEAMLKNLPPEKRAEIEKALKAQGQQMPSSGGEKSKPSLTSTGRTKTINQFACAEYRATQDDETTAIWASSANPRMAKLFHEFSKEFKNSLGVKGEDSPEELLPPDKFPVLTLTYSGTELSTTEITSVKETSIPLATFEEFKNPKLKKGTMMDMMNMRGGKDN